MASQTWDGCLREKVNQETMGGPLYTKVLLITDDNESDEKSRIDTFNVRFCDVLKYSCGQIASNPDKNRLFEGSAIRHLEN